LDDLDDDAHLSYPSLSKSGSSSTLTERKKPNESDSRQITNRPLQPRGMTDWASTWSPQSIPDFLRSGPLSPKVPSLPPSPTSHNAPTRPRVVVRQASATRLGPPTAPPCRNLPPPPSKFLPYRSGQEDEPPISPGSSSGLSFTSAVTSNRDPPLNQIVTRSAEHGCDKESLNSMSSASHTIRKAISHQTFSKRVSNLSSTSGQSSPADDVVEDRVPRRQHSFHHNSRSILPSPRRNLPPVPSPSHPTLPSLDLEALTAVEKCKGSSPTSPGRKRLFSSGSAKRPSSQILSPGDDDRQSVFTSELTQDDGASTPNASGRSDSPALSDALSDPPPTSPDYTPQMIMSPAEMLRIEASWNERLEDHDVGMSRDLAHSFAPISTSHDTESLQSPSLPKHYIVNQASSTLVGGASSGTSPSRRQMIRLSASQSNMSSKDSPSPSSTHSPFVSSSLGLPPPPRPRRKTGNDECQASMLSLSPRPLRRRDSKASTRSQPVRSILKKPSFFNTNDGTQQRQSIPVLSKFAGNFLDLERGRDSFDTIRSEDEREG
jgi:hypothetical protein